MDYAEVRANASASIRDTGGPMMLTQAGAADYDPATSTADTPTKSYNGFAVQSLYSARDIDGTTILAGDARFLVAIDGVSEDIPKPASGDLIAFAGKTFRVVETIAVQPGGVPVMWKVQARA